MERLQTAQAEAAPAIEDASTAPPRPGEATLDAIAWAMNQSAPYGFDEFPLDDRRVTLLEGLTSRLLDMGFEGEVLVETHVGDFCMVAGEEGFELAPAGLDAGDCDQLGYAPGEAFELGLRQSVAFANFLGTAEEATQGRIRYVITSLGNAEPAVPYPPVASGASAGMWNAAARANNRVEITLLPAR
jgi:hypothetical protein